MSLQLKLNALVLCAMTLIGAPVQAASFLYIANAESRNISVFALDGRDGNLAELQRLDVDGMVMPLAVAPDHSMLYATIRSKPFRVLALGIDPASGKLVLRGQAPLPESMANISLDRSGRYLFAASFGGHMVSVSTVDAEGIPREAHQILPTPPNAHQITATAGNDLVYASTRGGDQLLGFGFDAVRGELTPHTTPALQLPAKSGPRHFVFSRNGRFVYLLDELDGCVHLLQRTPGSPALALAQSLSVVPADFTGKPSAADLHLTPDGRFLYASERGSNTLAGFRVDAATGRLVLIGHWPTETHPRGFNISPDGRYLFAVGQESHQISRYRIDAAGGQLALLGRTPAGQGPNWVEIVELP